MIVDAYGPVPRPQPFPIYQQAVVGYPQPPCYSIDQQGQYQYQSEGYTSGSHMGLYPNISQPQTPVGAVHNKPYQDQTQDGWNKGQHHGWSSSKPFGSPPNCDEESQFLKGGKFSSAGTNGYYSSYQAVHITGLSPYRVPGMGYPHHASEGRPTYGAQRMEHWGSKGV
ncbi:hypothetical protein NMG60_11024855 [Bertholletia excelsa]